MVAGHATVIWLAIGALTINKETPILPLSIEGCTNSTFTDVVTFVYTNNETNTDNFHYAYETDLKDSSMISRNEHR